MFQNSMNLEKIHSIGVPVVTIPGHCFGIKRCLQSPCNENIPYLNAQQKMIQAFFSNLKEVIVVKETKLSSLENAIQTNRQKIRALKKDLTSDDRPLSEEVIERKIVLDSELNFLYRLRSEIEELFNQIYAISDEYRRAKAEEAGINKEYHSASDGDKLITFENNFKLMLSKFGFNKIVSYSYPYTVKDYKTIT